MVRLKFKSRILAVTVCLLIGISLGYVVYLDGVNAAEEPSLEQQLSVFENSYGYVRDFYYREEDLEPDKLIYGALEGLVNSLDGAKVELLPRDKYEKLKEESPSVEGIYGIYLTTRGDTLLIGPPLESTVVVDGSEESLFPRKYLEGEFVAAYQKSPPELFRKVVKRLGGVVELQPRQSIYAAIRGMISKLDDSHTRLLKPDSYEEMQTATEQQFGGLGIHITMDDKLLIIAPMAGTPAFRNDLLPGDVIAAIDGKRTSELENIQEAVEKLRGEPGSEVTLTISRDYEEDFEVTITREVISIQSVHAQVLERDGNEIGVVRINNFGEKTASEVRKALDRLGAQSFDGLVLDLRNNPGGVLSAANDVADIWLSEGKIVYTRGRLRRQDMDVMASKKGTEPGYPMLVLVNGGSASGSEIVTGALKDQARALVAGETTFGKASVQSVFPLADQSALKLTTAGYYTPNGYEIQDKGISPHVVVKQDIPDTSVREQIRELQLGDTVLDFVRKHPEPSETELDNFISGLRGAGFDLPQKYIVHQVNKQQLAMEGRELAIDVSTDSQLDRALDLFVDSLNVDPWKPGKAIGMLKDYGQ